MRSVLLFASLGLVSGFAQEPVENKPEGEMYTRSFRVSPDFSSNAAKAASGDPADPFTTLTKRRTVKEILIDRGVTFPEGAATFFGGRSSSLVIRNTAENLEKIEAIIGRLNSMQHLQVSVKVSCFALEAGEREIGVAELKAAIAAGEVELIDFRYLVSKSGQRARAKDGDRLREGTKDPKGADVAGKMTERFVGTVLEIDPSIEGELEDPLIALKLSLTIPAPEHSGPKPGGPQLPPDLKCSADLKLRSGEEVLLPLIGGDLSSGRKVVALVVATASDPLGK